MNTFLKLMNLPDELFVSTGGNLYSGLPKVDSIINVSTLGYLRFFKESSFPC